MRVLLISTYELGHQPLHLASPAAALRGGGHEVRCLDLSVEKWDQDAAGWAEAVAFSVPMHTAMRMALRGAASLRQTRPGLPICLYGLYAGVSREATLPGLADRGIAGEYEGPLLDWVDGLEAAEAGNGAPPFVVELGRSPAPVPIRDDLPPLERYARLEVGQEHRLAGYVEASHGCAHRCRHCPVPVVYDGRTRAVPEEVVLADVAALVEAGARHVTFGDPDFLNRPHHSMAVARAVHDRFPEITFDCTTKVEHILRHDDLWAELASAGCLFVVSAFELVNDGILALVDKGHTTADAARAVNLLRDHGIEIRPSFLPFTPWTTVDDVLDILDFVAALDLVGNVDPVQYTIRLLLPEGSLLLDEPTLAPHLGGYDAERLTWTWTAGDPAVDRLQSRLAGLVEHSLHEGEPAETTYLRVRTAVLEAAAGRHPAELTIGATEGRPRLTEPWFC
jgi:radical SAM superfamily enzyme YgiQ (UPF0313 family)